jgi:hypothetical protein
MYPPPPGSGAAAVADQGQSAQELVIRGYPPEGGEMEGSGYLPSGSEESDAMYPPAHPAGLEKPIDPHEVGKVHGGDGTKRKRREAEVGREPRADSRPPPGAYIVHGQSDSERDRGRRAFIYRGFGAKL